MGYFSEIAINRNTYFQDISGATHKQQLLWRCEDLQNRLEELKLQGLPYISSGCLTKDDLCYALPYCFGTIYDAEKALELLLAEKNEVENREYSFDFLFHDGGSIADLRKQAAGR